MHAGSLNKSVTNTTYLLINFRQYPLPCIVIPRWEKGNDSALEKNLVLLENNSTSWVDKLTSKGQWTYPLQEAHIIVNISEYCVYPYVCRPVPASDII
jgi:hypothetical protein